jgi:hypothetical protein
MMNKPPIAQGGENVQNPRSHPSTVKLSLLEYYSIMVKTLVGQGK